MTTKHARLVVLAALAVALSACQPLQASAGSSDAPSPLDPAPSTSTPIPAPSVLPSATPSPTRVADPVDCQPRDLDPRPYYSFGGGGMGTTGWYVIVQNTRSTGCRLKDYPVLYDGGTPIRQDRAQNGQQSVLLPPGKHAAFAVLTHIGYTGYDKDAPACQHPERYQNLSVALADGKRFPLPGLVIGFQCEQAHLDAWGISDGLPLPSPSRAP